MGCGGDDSGSQHPPTPTPTPTPSPTPGIIHFVPYSHAFWSNPANWTTDYGPAYADILLTGSNFLPCRGGPFALCYYSGPSSGPEDLSCTLTPDGLYANCQCFDIPYGVYFVDINAILNHAVYENTVAQCGADGSLCGTTNSAPVCQAINTGDIDSRRESVLDLQLRLHSHQRNWPDRLRAGTIRRMHDRALLQDQQSRNSPVLVPGL